MKTRYLVCIYEPATVVFLRFSRMRVVVGGIVVVTRRFSFSRVEPTVAVVSALFAGSTTVARSSSRGLESSISGSNVVVSETQHESSSLKVSFVLVVAPSVSVMLLSESMKLGESILYGNNPKY